MWSKIIGYQNWMYQMQSNRKSFQVKEREVTCSTSPPQKKSCPPSPRGETSETLASHSNLFDTLGWKNAPAPLHARVFLWDAVTPVDLTLRDTCPWAGRRDAGATSVPHSCRARLENAPESKERWVMGSAPTPAA